MNNLNKDSQKLLLSSPPSSSIRYLENKNEIEDYKGIQKRKREIDEKIETENFIFKKFGQLLKNQRFLN